jgi:hypothetical protein
MKCGLCENCGWVCHAEAPRIGEHACSCGGAGIPCLRWVWFGAEKVATSDL